jgi:hypothetical protein
LCGGVCVRPHPTPAAAPLQVPLAVVMHQALQYVSRVLHLRSVFFCLVASPDTLVFGGGTHARAADVNMVVSRTDFPSLFLPFAGDGVRVLTDAPWVRVGGGGLLRLKGGGGGGGGRVRPGV